MVFLVSPAKDLHPTTTSKTSKMKYELSTGVKVELLNTSENILAKGETAHNDKLSFATMFLNVICLERGEKKSAGGHKLTGAKLEKRMERNSC